MAGIPFITEGVTFGSVRDALCLMYFGFDGMTEEEWLAAHKYVVPLQHNFDNPIEAGSQDTCIEYWIDDDDRLTQDHNEQTVARDDNDVETDVYCNSAQKLARITVRFIGKYAESWAKVFQHLTKRESVAKIFLEYCNATFLEYIGKIVPVNVDYFGVAGTAVAFDIVADLQYNEVISLPSNRLNYVSLGNGAMGTGE